VTDTADLVNASSVVYALEDPLCVEDRIYKGSPCPLVSPRGPRTGVTIALTADPCPSLVSATAVG